MYDMNGILTIKKKNKNINFTMIFVDNLWIMIKNHFALYYSVLYKYNPSHIFPLLSGNINLLGQIFPKCGLRLIVKYLFYFTEK